MFCCAEQSKEGREVDVAIAAAQIVASRRAAESRAQAALMVEAVEDRAYEVRPHHALECCALHCLHLVHLTCTPCNIVIPCSTGACLRKYNRESVIRFDVLPDL